MLNFHAQTAGLQAGYLLVAQSVCAPPSQRCTCPLRRTHTPGAGPRHAADEATRPLPPVAHDWRAHARAPLAGLPQRTGARQMVQGLPVCLRPDGWCAEVCLLQWSKGTFARSTTVQSIVAASRAPSARPRRAALQAPLNPPACLCHAHLLAQVQPESKFYSRGVRQRIAKAAQEGGWLEKYNITVGE